MGDNGGAQASRRGRDGRDGRDAREQNYEPGGQQRKKDNSQPNQQWQKLKETLKQIEDDLTKEEEETPQH